MRRGHRTVIHTTTGVDLAAGRRLTHAAAMSRIHLYDHARRHRGVVDVRWGPRVGLTPETVLARARRERWRNPYEHVFLLPGATWDHGTDLVAAQTACRADAAARPPRRSSTGWRADHQPVHTCCSRTISG